MKALKVYESLDFKRGDDPHNTLNVGHITLAKKWLDQYKITVPVTFENNRIIWHGDFYPHEKLTSMPDNMTIEGNVNLQFQPIEKFPQNLHVKGNLGLHFSTLNPIGKNLKVDGFICLYAYKGTEKVFDWIDQNYDARWDKEDMRDIEHDIEMTIYKKF